MILGSALFGNAFENWVFHELSAYNTYADADTLIAYWRLASGTEVDFIVNDMQVAIERIARPSHRPPRRPTPLGLPRKPS